MPIALAISPEGRLFVEEGIDGENILADRPTAKRIAAAFDKSLAHGLLHLATAELQTDLPSSFAFRANSLATISHSCAIRP